MHKSQFYKRVIMVFREDGLGLDDILDDFKSRNLEVEKIIDNNLEFESLEDGSKTEEKIKLIIVSGKWSDMVKLKLDYNCCELTDERDVWFPMESQMDKLMVDEYVKSGAH